MKKILFLSFLCMMIFTLTITNVKAEGENKYDEEADSLTDNQLKNIGIILAKLHSAPLIDEDNDSWINYLNDALEKTQEVLSKVFGKDNETIYNYLKGYINNELKGNYKNSILHMDFRIGNLMFNEEEVGIYFEGFNPNFFSLSNNVLLDFAIK